MSIVRLLRFSFITFLLIICYFSLHKNRKRLLQEADSLDNISPKAIEQYLEKLIVVASQEADDTSWLQRRLPEWPVARYIVDSPHAQFRVPLNKGREAMVYLTHVIDNYDNLPDITIFIHSSQYQWHNEDPNHDGASVLSRLQLPYVLAEGYVNLRCHWEYGCPEELHPNAPTAGVSLETGLVFEDEFLESEFVFKDAYRELFYGGEYEGVEIEIPDAVGASCCAQFAVTREKILERPRSDYERMRNWLFDTTLDDAVSGRVFEYSWHMIFGKPAVFCPTAQSCYCNVFGLCELDGCDEGACEGRYVLPPFTDLPDDWKELPADEMD